MIKTSYFKNGMWIILVFTLLDLAIHLYSNAFANYGLFRDEFYYLACSKRLAAGYVDQPPFSIYILALCRYILGDSLFAIRLISALGSAVTVYYTGKLVKKLDGRNWAIVIACAALISAPIFLAINTIYSMNTFDWMFSVITAYILVLIIKEKKEKLWILLGLTVGLGLLNKVGFLWIGLGITTGLILTRERYYLVTKWPYLAGLLAIVIFSPFIIWNMTHNWAHIEFIKNATSSKYSSLNAITFLTGFILMLNPLTMFIWIAGLYFFFFDKSGKRYRMLGIIFIVSLAILLINGHSKSEYLAPESPILFAGGGILFERLSTLKFFHWVKYVLLVLILSTGFVLAPLALPLLPVKNYIAYAAGLGIKPSSSENKRLSELPQFYADMFGWKNMALTVSKVYASLSSADRKRAIIFARNYGEAGAIEYYSGKFFLPHVISFHNNYWIWGYDGATKNSIVIAIGGNKSDYQKSFDSVEQAAVIINEYAMPYEDNLPVFICRGLKYPLEQIWRNEKNFE